MALGAQAAIPLPGTPVPMTLQVPAVLIVGGLLGPAAGAASLVVYLVLGAVGLPVFAAVGPSGFARLLGPTGGYLLAFPIAAALVGVLVGSRESWRRIALAMVAGLAVIHLGGVSQLWIMTGSADAALRLGSVPFLLGDLLKLVVAGLVIGKMPRSSGALL